MIAIHVCVDHVYIHKLKGRKGRGKNNPLLCWHGVFASFLKHPLLQVLCSFDRLLKLHMQKKNKNYP